jgi:tRNA 2-selenouridine synthase SelU
VIKGSNGEKTTARWRAREILMDALATASMRLTDERYWTAETDGLTDREREEIVRFLKKEGDRAAKVLGFQRITFV